jgi:hypothetical protein
MSTQRRAAATKNPGKPKHTQLRETLRVQIESLQPDQPIPSEHELCAQYGAIRRRGDWAQIEIAVAAERVA